MSIVDPADWHLAQLRREVERLEREISAAPDIETQDRLRAEQRRLRRQTYRAIAVARVRQIFTAH